MVQTAWPISPPLSTIEQSRLLELAPAEKLRERTAQGTPHDPQPQNSRGSFRHSYFLLAPKMFFRSKFRVHIDHKEHTRVTYIQTLHKEKKYSRKKRQERPGVQISNRSSQGRNTLHRFFGPLSFFSHLQAQKNLKRWRRIRPVCSRKPVPRRADTSTILFSLPPP